MTLSKQNIDKETENVGTSYFSFNNIFLIKIHCYFSTYCRNDKYFIENLKSLAGRQHSPVHSVEDSGVAFAVCWLICVQRYTA
jgi:hypothetical protein